MGSAGGKGWNSNSAASQVSNSRNSACSTNVKNTGKRPSARTTGGAGSSVSKGAASGRTGGGGGSAAASAAAAGQKGSCPGSSVAGDASSVGSHSHGQCHGGRM